MVRAYLVEGSERTQGSGLRIQADRNIVHNVQICASSGEFSAPVRAGCLMWRIDTL